MIASARFEDVLYIAANLRAADRVELAATRADMDAVRLTEDAVSRATHAAVAFDREGRPALVLGVSPVHRGVVTVWGFGTERYRDVGVEMTRFAKRVIIPAVIASGVHRAQCLVHPGNRASQRWLAALGFEPEATLAGFGSGGEDMILYARVVDAKSRR